MSRFTKNFVHTFDFDGDKIVAKFRRMTRKQALTLAPHMKDGKVTLEENLESLEIASPIIDECLVSLNGLTIEDQEVLKGSDAYNEYVMGDLYFMPLLGQMLGVLVSMSILSEDEVKKSAATAGASSEASTSKDAS